MRNEKKHLLFTPYVVVSGENVGTHRYTLLGLGLYQVSNKGRLECNLPEGSDSMFNKPPLEPMILEQCRPWYEIEAVAKKVTGRDQKLFLTQIVTDRQGNPIAPKRSLENGISFFRRSRLDGDPGLAVIVARTNDRDEVWVEVHTSVIVDQGRSIRLHPEHGTLILQNYGPSGILKMLDTPTRFKSVIKTELQSQMDRRFADKFELAIIAAIQQLGGQDVKFQTERKDTKSERKADPKPKVEAAPAIPAESPAPAAKAAPADTPPPKLSERTEVKDRKQAIERIKVALSNHLGFAGRHFGDENALATHVVDKHVDITTLPTDRLQALAACGITPVKVGNHAPRQDRQTAKPIPFPDIDAEEEDGRDFFARALQGALRFPNTFWPQLIAKDEEGVSKIRRIAQWARTETALEKFGGDFGLFLTGLRENVGLALLCSPEWFDMTLPELTKSAPPPASSEVGAVPEVAAAGSANPETSPKLKRQRKGSGNSGSSGGSSTLADAFAASQTLEAQKRAGLKLPAWLEPARNNPDVSLDDLKAAKRHGEKSAAGMKVLTALQATETSAQAENQPPAEESGADFTTRPAQDSYGTNGAPQLELQPVPDTSAVEASTAE